MRFAYRFFLPLTLLLCGCIHRLPSDSPRVSSNIPVLLYHHVENLPPDASNARRRWTITPETFNDQMAWLSGQGFYPVSMRQWLEGKLPQKPIILTFDDGWKDHYTTVLPVLQKYGFTATFFIISESVGSSAYMTWVQVQALAQAGMDIQSHTANHRRLSTLALVDARREIVGSKRTIEEHLKQPVEILAYPFGSYDDNVIALTQDAGYKAAVTVSGLNGGYLFRADRTFTLERYAVEHDDNLKSILRVKGFLP